MDQETTTTTEKPARAAARDHYDNVDSMWPKLPPCSRVEAEKAATRLRRKFGMPASSRVRACWVSLEGRRLDKGWARLVHDLSHLHSRALFPRLRWHGPHHARIERDMVAYVLAQGWLGGSLKAKAGAPVTDADKLARLRERFALWEAKHRRAVNALKKLQAKIRYYERKAS